MVWKRNRPANVWMEAFFLLEQLLERLDNGSRQVVFIDELPWMDTSRSGFLTALEAFWNGWGCNRHNLCLVVCGSATSWMLDNIINNKGGLYGRLTCEMKLSPFTLLECEQFFASRNISMSRYNIIQAYMILGGIPSIWIVSIHLLVWHRISTRCSSIRKLSLVMSLRGCSTPFSTMPPVA